MNVLAPAWTVVQFELQRTLTFFRLLGWLVLACFPPLVVLLLKFQLSSEDPVPDMIWQLIIFELDVEVVTLLGLLLWATPLIHSELEAHAWTYLAVRPGGRIGVVLGKYLTAVLWTGSAACAGVTLSTIIVQPPELPRVLGYLWLACLLSALTYGALYCLIGVILPKRAMVLAVAYTLILEFLVSFIPAMINELTVHYRLRSTLYNQLSWQNGMPEDMSLIFSDKPTWTHLAALAVMLSVFLGTAITWVVTREYVSGSDT